MIQFVLGVLLLLQPAVVDTSQSFEGTIRLKQSSKYNTYYYEYFIKDNLVRVDKSSKDGQELGSYIIDLEKLAVFAINHQKHLYVRHTPIDLRLSADDVEIIKSENSKMINGYICYQWRVRNRSTNTEYAFWVTNEVPTYSYDLLGNLLQDIDKAHYYYSLIPNKENFMPLEAVERNLVRKERFRSEVIEIDPQTLSESLFSIPDNYQKLEK